MNLLIKNNSLCFGKVIALSVPNETFAGKLCPGAIAGLSVINSEQTGEEENEVVREFFFNKKYKYAFGNVAGFLSLLSGQTC